MSLINCNECGRQVSTQAKNCPNCGAPIVTSENIKIEHYKKAAEQGDAESQYNLGVCYAKGYGVIENREQAIYWLLKAASQNHERAIKLLEILY